MFGSNLRKMREPVRKRPPPRFFICWRSPGLTRSNGAAAAVTGAAGGIGRALALELAARGCDLALADRDEAGLQTLAAEIGTRQTSTGQKVSVHRVDVGEPAQIAGVAQDPVAADPT